MARAAALAVVIDSLGSTEGLRRADDELRDSLRRAGASVAIARALPPAEIPTLMLTDLVWARAARDAATKMLADQHRSPARSVIYSSTTAALLWPRPGAIRFDATSAGNRPGRHGLWQRPLERRRLRQAPLLLPWSEAGLCEAPQAARREDRAVVLPVPVEASCAPDCSPPAAGGTGRDIAAITYAANPSKKGLDRVLSAWRQARSDRRAGAAEEELFVAGACLEALERAVPVGREQDGVRFVGCARSARLPRVAAPRARVRVRSAARGLRGSPSSRRSSTAPSSSPRPRVAHTRRCRLRASLTRAWSARISQAPCAWRSTTLFPTTPRAPAGRSLRSAAKRPTESSHRLLPRLLA